MKYISCDIMATQTLLKRYSLYKRSKRHIARAQLEYIRYLLEKQANNN